MSKKEVLVLGGGVAGSSLAYFLHKKGYKVKLIEKNSAGVGGLSRTYKYAGHPYEFGPHIWFWTDEELNSHIRKLANDELYYIDRKLFTYVEKDRKKYRYPIHFSSINEMSDKEEILKQLQVNRDKNYKLKPEKLPVIGECKFEDYFKSAIGKNLYSKFMEDYTHKMWNIPGNKLETSMVWADRFKHEYEKLKGYDPIKFEDHTLGKGINFQIYPKKGWNQIWDTMVKDAEIIVDEVVKIYDEDSDAPYILTKNTGKYYFSDYHAVINTLDMDLIWGEDSLEYTGRMIVPLLMPDLNTAFPENTESFHYSGKEFQTRVTEMKTITKYESSETLILIEIPVTSKINDNAFPENVISNAKENNLFCKRAYPQQTKEMFKIYDRLKAKGKNIKNLYHCGRHAEFKYWGMPETVNSAFQLTKLSF